MLKSSSKPAQRLSEFLDLVKSLQSNYSVLRARTKTSASASGGFFPLSDKQKVKALLKKPNYIQKSNEWFQLRKNKITASDAACVLPLSYPVCKAFLQEFGLCGIEKGGNPVLETGYIQNIKRPCFQLNHKKWGNPYSSREEFVLKKCGHVPFSGNVATRHGVKYEQVACDIYARIKNTRIYELGLIEHEKYSWLGASPDGITYDGTLLEIKVPYRRNPTGIPPFYYWVQMQLQLQCCMELDKCDFIECVISEFNTEDEFMQYVPDETLNQEKGIIMEISSTGTGTGTEIEYKHIYPPVNLTDQDGLLNWSDSQIVSFYNKQKENKDGDGGNGGGGGGNIVKRFWKLDKLVITPVRRSEQWFETVKPILYKAWCDVNIYKERGIEESRPTCSIDEKFHSGLYKKYLRAIKPEEPMHLRSSMFSSINSDSDNDN
jgi:putative phage-type endonuclease